MDLLTRKKLHSELGPETGPNSSNGGTVVDKQAKQQQNRSLLGFVSFRYVVGFEYPAQHKLRKCLVNGWLF